MLETILRQVGARRNVTAVLSVFAALIWVGCNQHPAFGRMDMSDEVVLTAEIRDYTPNAMRDEFNNGSFQYYDATKLRILSPAALSRDLTVYHAGPIGTGSLWRGIGKKITAHVKISDLNMQVLFDGAFRDVHLVP